MARELHAVHAFPDTHTVSGFHTNQHGGQCVVNQTDYGSGTASWMRLSVAGNALRSFDANNNRISLCRATNSHRDGFTLVEAK